MGQFDKAQHFYATAKDSFSLVRIACFGRDVGKAKQLVEEAAQHGAANQQVQVKLKRV